MQIHSWPRLSNILFGGSIPGTFVRLEYFYRFCDLINVVVWGDRGIFRFNTNMQNMDLWLNFYLQHRAQILTESCWLHLDHKQLVATLQWAISGHNIIWCKVFYSFKFLQCSSNNFILIFLHFILNGEIFTFENQCIKYSSYKRVNLQIASHLCQPTLQYVSLYSSDVLIHFSM